MRTNRRSLKRLIAWKRCRCNNPLLLWSLTLMETHCPVSLHHHTIVPLCPLRQCVVTLLRLYGKFHRLLSSLSANVSKFTRSFLRNIGNSSQRNTLSRNTFNKPLVLQVVLIRDLLMFLFFSSCDWTPHFCLFFSNAARFPIITPWWRTCWRFSFVIKACRERARIVSAACLSSVFRNGAFSLRLCSVVRHWPHSG